MHLPQCTCIMQMLYTGASVQLFSAPPTRPPLKPGCLATAIELEKGRVGVAGNTQLLSELL